jgi:ABC-type sugar transport system, periplasmic component
MLKERRILALFLAIFSICLLVSGCGGNTSGNSTQASTASAATQTEKENLEPITFTYFRAMTNGVDPYPENDFAKLIKEQTGITIEVEDVVGDLDTKIGVMIASGDYPDFIWGNDRHYKFIDAGALIPLDDYIDKYGANTKKVYDGYFKQMAWDDGNIYFLSPRTEDVTYKNPTAAMYIQKAVLKEFGWPKVTTVDQYFDLLIKYKEKYPSIDGKETIPFSIITDSWRIFTLYNPTRYVSGRDNNQYDVDDKTLDVHVPLAEDWQKKWYKKINELYNKGYVDKESFSMTYDKYIEKLSTGRVLGMHDYSWQIQSAEDSIVQQGKTDRYYVPLAISWDENTKEHYIDAPMFGSRDGVSISKNCKDPERAFKFLDWLLNEDIQKQIYWGVKDKDYYVNEDGKYYQKHDMSAEAKAKAVESSRKNGRSLFTYPWPRGANNKLYADGNVWDPSGSKDEVYAEYGEYEKEFLDAYHIKTYTDLFNSPIKRPFGYLWNFSLPSDSEENQTVAKIGEIDKEWVTKCITGSTDKFEENWSEYGKKLKALDTASVEKWYKDTITKYVEKLKN